MSGLIRAAGRSRRERGVVLHALLFVVVSALAGVLVSGLVIPFAGMLGLTARGVSDSFDSMDGSLPNVELAQRSYMYAADGTLLATFWDENRTSVDLDKVAPVMRDAVIAIEDARFYDHGPMDVQGTLRAFMRNTQSGSGATSQGGSTITQQYVKQVLVQATKEDKAKKAKVLEESYGRKLQELRYAVELEKDKQKDEILAGYLNIVYFGDGAWGVESAAKHFFNVKAIDLTLPQAALLAGLVRDPNGLDPTRKKNVGAALQRRDLVLSRMVTTGKISREVYEKTTKLPLGLKINDSKNGCNYAKWPEFCDYTFQWLLKDKALGKDETERKRAILGGGLTIRTTIDMKAQTAAQNAVRKRVKSGDNAFGAISIVEPGTGEIVAMAQSKPYGGDKRKHETYLNYNVAAADNGGIGVQPGSTFKPFVLAAAFDKKLKPGAMLPSPQSMPYPEEMKTCGKDWKASGRRAKVSNSTRAGADRINAFKGTQRSVNTYYLSLEKLTGLCRPYQIATAAGVKMGISGRKLQQVPSFVLGTNNVTPLSMAEAYATFAARGWHCSAIPVRWVEDRRGSKLQIRGAGCNQAIEKKTADAVNFVLQQVVDGKEWRDPSRTGKDMMIKGRQVAGKTGTNEERKYVSFAGYTPNLAAYAVVGGQTKAGNELPLLKAGRIGGKRVSDESIWGGKLAGPIWKTAMKGALEGRPIKKFAKPDKELMKGRPLDVPDVVGKEQEEAEDILADAEFTPEVVAEENSLLPKGTVTRQSPAGNAKAPSGGVVQLWVSNGIPPVDGCLPGDPTCTPCPIEDPNCKDNPDPKCKIIPIPPNCRRGPDGIASEPAENYGFGWALR